MYEMKRRPKITEQLKIGDQVLNIEITPDAIIKEYARAQVSVIKAQDALREAKTLGNPSPEIVQHMGEAIVELMTVLLGQENTERLVAFFESDYAEMLLVVMPFIVDVIKPKMDAAVKDIHESMRNTYKRGKCGNKWDAGKRLFGRSKG